MPEPEYVQQNLFALEPGAVPAEDALAEVVAEEVLPAVEEDLLDDSSLSTVLDMLAVIDSVEELALLETLTDAQKRQVWAATPEVVKIRLKQMRAAASEHRSSVQSSIQSAAGSPEAGLEIEPEDENNLNAEWQELEAVPALSTPQPLTGVSLPEPTPAIGDWIVLKAKPKLTAAELIAIWEVTNLEGDYAQVKTEKLGTRLYPTRWMIIYPKCPPTPRSPAAELEDDF